MQKIIFITTLLALATLSFAATLTPSVNLVTTYPNGHLQYQYGDLVNYTTAVAQIGTASANAPTGSVSIIVDGNQRGSSCNLAASVPSSNIVCTVPEVSGATALTVGPHNFTSRYSGDGTYLPTDSTVQTLIIYAQANLVIVATPQNPTASQAITITVTTNLNPQTQTPAPTGTIQFVNNGVNLTQCTVTNGGCMIIIPANSVPAGTYTVVGTYTGNTVYAPSSGSVTFTVGAATTTTTTTTTTSDNSASTTTAAAAASTTTAAAASTTNAAAASTTSSTSSDSTSATTDATATTNTANSNTGANTNANTIAAGTAFTGSTTAGAASVCASAFVTVLAVALAL